MNLCEARKLAHEGWVRSPSTGNRWLRLIGNYFYKEGDIAACAFAAHHIDTEDWEPKPAPAKPFEAEVWVARDGAHTFVRPGDLARDWPGSSWRRVRVREVTE